MSDGNDAVRYNVQMPQSLRNDAKRVAERGELAKEVRELFRRIAYGNDGMKKNPEKKRLKAELRDAREHLDNLRSKRRRIEGKIEDEELRTARLEERIDELGQQHEKFENVVESLEQVLLNGGRIVPERVDDDLNAQEVIRELRDRNEDVPDIAFRLAKPHEHPDWRKAQT